MKKLFAIALITVLLSNQVVFAQTAYSRELSEKIESFIEEHEANMAAMSVAVFTNQDILFENAYGYINLEENTANTLDNSVFEWASVTKLLVSVSVLQLYERGYLNLDIDIRAYLHDGFLTGLRYDDPITILHLLNHSAGFQESTLELAVRSGNQIRDLSDSLYLLQPPQLHQPGAVTSYSNFGIALAGYIVELITGMPFYEYVHQNIFSPLGMTGTGLRPDLQDNPWVSQQIYNINSYNSNLQRLDVAYWNIQWYPAGSATGTISDFRKFGQALLADENGKSPLFENAETLRRMYTPTSYFPDGVTGRLYHAFIGEPFFGGHVIGHGGNTNMTAGLFIDIENGIGAVIMTNQSQETIFNRQMPRLIFGVSDFAQINQQRESTISGLFNDVATFQRGMFRATRIFMIQPFGEILLPSQVEGAYIFDQLSFVFFASEENLSNVIIDFAPVSLSTLIFDALSHALILIGGLYGLISLIFLILSSRKKKEKILPWPRGFIYVAFILAGTSWLSFAFNQINVSFTYGLAIAHGIVFALAALVIIISLVLTIVKMRAFKLNIKSKLQFTITFIMGLLVVSSILYFQLWML